jgi:ribonuclease HII
MPKHAKVPTLAEEALLWNQHQGGVFVFGVDEAGRGCLAGPVCAAVACWAPREALPEGVAIRDSKQMTEAQREAAFEPVRQGALAHGVGFASCEEIDRFNILRANHLAVARALEMALRSLGPAAEKTPFVFLADGNQPLVSKALTFVENKEFASELPLVSNLFKRKFSEFCHVKGDSKVFSIAAASVLAKVSRDRHMHELDRLYPDYEFAAHKGYSTPRHVAILRTRGPCSEHRRSFSPVSESLQLFPQA